jgi:hypothetical protein
MRCHEIPLLQLDRDQDVGDGHHGEEHVRVRRLSVPLRPARRKKRSRSSNACSRGGGGKRDCIEHDPDYDILRDDPRFKTLVARLK